MPGDPEIDRDVKSGEEKLWEAVYDNKTDKVEHILNTYLTGRLSPPDGPGIDLNWKWLLLCLLEGAHHGPLMSREDLLP